MSTLTHKPTLWAASKCGNTEGNHEAVMVNNQGTDRHIDLYWSYIIDTTAKLMCVWKRHIAKTRRAENTQQLNDRIVSGQCPL